MSGSTLTVAPRGEDGVIAAFGDPYKVMGADGVLDGAERLEWEKRLVRVPFWYPVRLSWGKPGQVATVVRCHERIAERFASVFRTIGSDATLRSAVKTYGGAYEFRTKRSDSTQLSMHSWGIAIDFNVATNRMGTPGDMHPGLVQVFEAAGFEWGGRWRHSDPMHFQFASGA